MVLELNRRVDPDEWRRAGLGVLDDSDTSALVAFSERDDLDPFLERLSQYREAEESEKGSLRASELFDAIETMRWYGAEDRVGPELALAIEGGVAPATGADLDVEVWFPGTRETAYEWVTAVRAAIGQLDGLVVDSRVDADSGVILVRARLDVAEVTQLARVDEIAVIDLAPAVHLPHGELVDLSIEDFGDAVAPSPDAPILAVIDSGVSGAHPLIAPALYEATTLLPGLSDGSDEHGHGTGVAGVALFGPAEQWIDRLRETGEVPTPVGRLLSVRVLDHRNEFPAGLTWGHALVDAIEYAARMGAKIVNVSVGHPGGIQTLRRSTPVASMLDTVARELGVVLVVPTGNGGSGFDDLAADETSGDRYCARLVADSDRRLLDPAPAALALTVGGTVGRIDRLPAADRQLGSGDSPSALTRCGPGTAGAIKPELVAPAGTRAWNPAMGVVDRKTILGQPVLSNRSDALFERDAGTSYAAPAVAHSAGTVLAEHPGLSSQLIRALVLQSARPTSLSESVMPGAKPAERRRQRLHVAGHGTPDGQRAAFSAADRVVLTAETQIAVDSVVVYEVPLPLAFFEPGGRRTLELAIAFDPLTRHRRQDYLGSRLFAYVIHGQSVERIFEVLGRATEEDLEAKSVSDELAPGKDETEAATPDGPEGSGADEPDSAASALDPWKLDPSPSACSDSANMLRTWTRRQRLERAKGDVAYLAIRSTNRWAPSTREDPVGIALALGYEGSGDVDLHADLHARISVPVEVSVEVDPH